MKLYLLTLGKEKISLQQYVLANGEKKFLII